MKKIFVFSVLFVSLLANNLFALPDLELPFPSGESWEISCVYQDNRLKCYTHAEYRKRSDGTFILDGNGQKIKNKDEFALDFNFHKTPPDNDAADDDCGKSIVAVAGGTISKSYLSDSYGNAVEINHGNGYFSFYAHFQSRSVSMGDVVFQGQQIGLCGNTGTNSCHLHFVLYYQANNTAAKSSVKPELMSGYSGYTGFVAGKVYTSLNSYNIHNAYRVGKFADGFHLETESSQYFIPYSRPFALSYHHNGGEKSLGHPTNDVHLFPTAFYPYNSFFPQHFTHITH